MVAKKSSSFTFSMSVVTLVSSTSTPTAPTKPVKPEHQALLSALNQDPTDTTFLGAGYVLERAGWPVEPVEPVEDTAGIELTMRGAGAGNTTEEGSDPGGGEESRGKVVLSRN